MLGTRGGGRVCAPLTAAVAPCVRSGSPRPAAVACFPESDNGRYVNPASPPATGRKRPESLPRSAPACSRARRHAGPVCTIRGENRPIAHEYAAFW